MQALSSEHLSNMKAVLLTEVLMCVCVRVCMCM